MFWSDERAPYNLIIVIICGAEGCGANFHAQAFAAIYFVDKKYVIRKIEMIA